MNRLLLASLVAIIGGCAVSPKPVSDPGNQRCIRIPGEGCKKFTAGNVGGTTLGHSNEDITEENNP